VGSSGALSDMLRSVCVKALQALVPPSTFAARLLIPYCFKQRPNCLRPVGIRIAVQRGPCELTECGQAEFLPARLKVLDDPRPQLTVTRERSHLHERTHCAISHPVIVVAERVEEESRVLS